MSFIEGLTEIVLTLQEKLGPGAVLVNAPAVALTRKSEGDRAVYEVSFEKNGVRQGITADLVVLAIPAYDGSTLMEKLDPAVAAALRSIPYAGMAVVHVGYAESDMPAPLDGFGFLIPGSEKRAILGGLWASSIFAGRAPGGKVLITTMMGGAKDPGIRKRSEAELVATARAELRHTMGITAEPGYVKVLRWDNAIPQYLPGHLNVVDDIERRFAAGHPGLFLTGNAFRGISVNDCVGSGQKVAAAGVEYLRKLG